MPKGNMTAYYKKPKLKKNNLKGRRRKGTLRRKTK